MAAIMTSQAEVRKNMSEFWKVHSKNADLDEMMLDSNAENLNKFEMNEILTMIPDYTGKNLLELGAGIGRYTGEFCKTAKKVVAVDFMESFVEKNRENNKNFNNLQHICDDVMNLQFAESSFDVIFSNWLFMYLSDDDIKTLTSRMLKWLKPNGIFFVRESCNRPSGNMKRSENPTFYRTQPHYNNLLTSSCISGSQFGIIWSRPIETYIRFKNNKNQICWLLQSKQQQQQHAASADSIMTSQAEVRKNMSEFWKVHSKNADLDEMMLDSNAENLNKFEMNEILTMIPDYTGKNLLELGAGIGRYTGEFCKTAKKVVAVDFMESFVEKNRENNKNFNNLHHICDDVMNLQFAESSFDVIFSNWLFMYLSDDDIKTLTSRMLKWLKPNGIFFVRESCNRPSGNMKRSENPTFYRTQPHYNNLLTSSRISGSQFGIIWSRPIETYIRFKKNENQICWLLQSKQTQESYKNPSKEQIQLYQEIHGKTFLDSGADVINQKITSLMEINECDVILDIGCGLGGNGRFLAKQFGCAVTGIDRSPNLIEMAQHGRHNDPLADKLHYSQADVQSVEYPQDFYDVVYTRDALFQNRGKEEILRKILKWLKIGGKLVLVDYCCSNETMATDREESCLISASQYTKILQEVGFQGVHEEELSNNLVENLQQDFEAFDWPEKSENKILQNEEKVSMEEKIEELKNGNIHWFLFTASK